MYEVLFALMLIFSVAAVFLLLAAQWDLPVIPFYLLAGIFVGVVIDETQLLDLAQWGVAFLVFLFGVHVDLEFVRSTGRLSVAVSVLQAAVVGGLGFGAGLALGLDAINASYLGITAALSSSLVATSYLDTTAGVRPTYARLAESVHFTEDVLGVLAVLTLSAVVYAATPAWEQFAVAAGIVALALLIRYTVFHRLTARLRGDSEILMLVGISFVVGFIALAEAAALSIVVGAFAAGIAVADDYPHSLELVDTVDDLEDFFSPIFFVTLGALLTLPGLETAGYTLTLLVAILVLNPVLAAALFVRAGFDGRTAVLTALTLDQVSIFSLFIAIEALGAEQIARPVFDAIVLAAVVSMLVATYTGRHAESIAQWLRDRGFARALGESVTSHSSVADDLSDHVIVVDLEYGGRELVERAADSKWGQAHPFLVIEDDPSVLGELESICDNYVYGDVSNDDVWEQARLSDAALVVALTPRPARADAVVALETDIPRLVRVDAIEDAAEFADRGATGVIYPDAIAAERVGDDLAALLAEELSLEEFEARARQRTRE
ncbi:sodium/hydrogen exchanger [Natrialba chahannaoensis JCM 10990]|uniref:Sodium/hydrogen exchanger n=1 Tax=Natrialba chahannaoensis JCM 10990 TaxID=1227492 RepID=M0AJ97_9EURY|nr:cation:proton antiporter [Natrialba chahannaoensis]ELY97478.1 sodium/hydrogen exchanger [Natrialba chahannaoensis JCM 10990]